MRFPTKTTSAAPEPSPMVPFQVADLSLLVSRTGLGLTTSHSPGPAGAAVN